MTNTREEVAPETSFEFVCEWFEKAANTAERQGKKESALLWRDGLQHLLHERANSQYLAGLVEALKAIYEIGDLAVASKVVAALSNLPEELRG